MNPEAYLEMAETEDRHWWFVGRRRVLCALIARLELPANARILEIGAGTGGNLKMLSRFGQVSALEMHDEARTIAARKTDGRFDIRDGRCPNDIPFAGETFDLICLFDVLEHIEEDQATLAALKALLAANGRLMVTVPAYRWLWSAHDVVLHHKRRYSPAELRMKGLAAGLRIETLSYFNTLLFPAAAAVRFTARLFGSSTVNGTAVPPAPLNAALRWIFGTERHLIGRLPLPFGVSLLAILSRR